MTVLLLPPAPAFAEAPAAVENVQAQPVRWEDVRVLATPPGLEARAVTTADSLYVRLSVQQPGGNVYLAVDPYRDGLGLFRVVVNSSGVPTFTSTRKTSWTTPGSVRVATTGRGWECIVRVPFAALSYPAGGTVQWSLAFGRSVDESRLAVATLCIPPPSRPILTSSANEASLSDSASVKYAVSSNASVNLTLPDGEAPLQQLAQAPGMAPVEFEQYRPFFQTGGALVTEPVVSPPFTERLDFLTGPLSETVGYQSNSTSEGPTMSVGWTSKPLPYVDKVQLGLSWAELKSPDGEVQSEVENLSAEVHLLHRWDLKTNLAEQDTPLIHDSQVGAAAAYSVTASDHLGVAVSEGTLHGEPETSVTLSGTVAPTRSTQFDLSYLTSDALALTTTPTRNRVWHGDVRYSQSKWRSFTLGVREDAQGTCNLYGVYRRDLNLDKEMILTLGDPSASATASQVLLKIVDRL